MDTHILAIDIGGTGIKASVLDQDGAMLADRVRVATPVGAPPEDYVATVKQLAAALPPFGRIAVGFPGVVRDGAVRTAPLLGHEAWSGYPLAAALEQALGRPCKLCNDADVHGFAAISGHGVEMVVTLGTGFGSSVYLDGRLGPHLELAHHRFRRGETYNEQLGDAALRRIGQRRWRKRVDRMLANMRTLVAFDHLYVGGGNARLLRAPLPEDVSLVDNDAGIRGGAWLWRDPCR